VRLTTHNAWEKTLNRAFDFQKRRQLLIGMHNETLSIAVRVSNPDCSPGRVHG
jgi:hypothetical protein